MLLTVFFWTVGDGIKTARGFLILSLIFVTFVSFIQAGFSSMLCIFVLAGCIVSHDTACMLEDDCYIGCLIFIFFNPF